jgi:hypothetical protein
MTNASSKTMRIQILLSVPLVLFGVVGIYLIHRARSESTQVTFRDLGGGTEAVESEQAGSMFYTDSPGLQTGMLVPPEDEPHKTQNRDTLKSSKSLKSLKSLSVERGTTSTIPDLESMVERLEKLKYDGYMRVGDMKLAWLSDGKDRIILGEGHVLDDTIRIDEIHENFLLVSLINQATTGAADSHIVREILFTRSPDDSGMGGQFGTRGQEEGRGDRAKGRRGEPPRSRVSIASQDRSAARPSEHGQVSNLPLPSSQSGPPLVPGQTSLGVTQRGASHGGNYGTVIYIDPASRAVKSVGETFTVRVRIDNGSNVFAVPFDINYDPNVLEVTGLHEGSYLKKDGGQTTFLTSIDRDRGKITIGLTRLGRIGGVSGSGTLMSIGFRALKRGTASLSSANEKPMDSDLNALPVKFAHGEVKVE